MIDNRSRRFWEVLFGIFLLVMGLALMGRGIAWLGGMALIGFGFWLVVRQFDSRPQAGASADGDAFDDEYERPEESSRPFGADHVYTHAVEAVRGAGLDPGTMSVLPVDLGVMAFRAGDEPVIHRTQPILDDVDYIQPFVQLRLPTRARGKIRFEIIDTDGQALFVREELHDLQKGRNLVTPAARLPIHDAQAMTGTWRLVVSADDLVIAQHRFGWRASTGRIVRQHVRQDGEISAELTAALQDSQPGSLSLDELLAQQDADERRAAGRG